MDLSDGYVIVVSRECETCRELAPAFLELASSDNNVTFVSQDDAGFPLGVSGIVDDSELEHSWRLGVEVTPTAIRVQGGVPGQRIHGWRKSEWREFFGMPGLAQDLPDHRPGCGSLTMLPGEPERLAARYGGGPVLASRRVEFGASEDEHEAMFARGWTDGLPVVPPTEERVFGMLAGTKRPPDEVVGVIPPDYRECTVEKVAVNAVMAGCRPEYLPVVIAAVKAYAAEPFNAHGVAATTWYSGPVVLVNGPIAKHIGMNSEHNAFGPGNRANASIGRALNLIARNVGGSRPGEVDRSTQGHPTKYTMAFAEREYDSPWTSVATERGVPEGKSAVTLFAGQGPSPIADQKSRTAESLVRSLAGGLRAVRHPKAVGRVAALVAVAPEHARIFGAAGWSKQRLREEIIALLSIPAAELLAGAGGIEEGLAPPVRETVVAKFKPENLWFAHVGGGAGGSSGIISGWVAGPKGSNMVTVTVEEG
jgi:thiol-disulfide isomerase/thioredoxin